MFVVICQSSSLASAGPVESKATKCSSRRSTITVYIARTLSWFWGAEASHEINVDSAGVPTANSALGNFGVYSRVVFMLTTFPFTRTFHVNVFCQCKTVGDKKSRVRILSVLCFVQRPPGLRLGVLRKLPCDTYGLKVFVDAPQPHGKNE